MVSLNGPSHRCPSLYSLLCGVCCLLQACFFSCMSCHSAWALFRLTGGQRCSVRSLCRGTVWEQGTVLSFSSLSSHFRSFSSRSGAPFWLQVACSLAAPWRKLPGLHPAANATSLGPPEGFALVGLQLSWTARGFPGLEPAVNCMY